MYPLQLFVQEMNELTNEKTIEAENEMNRMSKSFVTDTNILLPAAMVFFIRNIVSKCSIIVSIF